MPPPKGATLQVGIVVNIVKDELDRIRTYRQLTVEDGERVTILAVRSLRDRVGKESYYRFESQLMTRLTDTLAVYGIL